MVYSNLNSTVFYNESGNIDPEDVGHEAVLYEMEIFGKRLLVVFGKLKHTFIQRNVVYLPLYLVVHHKVKKQIGIIEFHKNDVLQLYDEENEIDIDKLNEPLLFGFVDQMFVDNSGSDSISFLQVQNQMEKEKQQEIEKVEEEEEKEESEEENSDVEDDVMSIKIKPSKLSHQTKEANKLLENGIFQVNKNVKVPSPLIEETKEVADGIRSNYQSSHRNNWVQEFMKNENYGIHEVERNGDCFFAVVRDAFQQIGQKTTVEKLRAILAKEVTEEVFENHRLLFNDLKGKINEYNREIKEIKNTLEVTQKQRAEKVSNNKSELRIVLEESERLRQKHKDLLRNKQIAQSMIDDDLGNLQAIDSVDKFKEFILTSGYWADSWAISTLEYVLKVKFVLLSERSYLDDDLYNVLLCGEASSQLQNANKFDPKYYIIATFSGDHYKLITYKDKRIFEFYELPYHIKSLIMNKCLEGNSGAFHYISEMKNMKLQLGLDEEDEIMHSIENSSLYNKDIVFVFHRKASNSFKPGMAKNLKEKIPGDKRSQFIELSRIKNWRRKLHDSWDESPFELDGKKWASVEHYYQSAKFRVHNPDFADLFSLDASESEIAKDVDLAICAGSKSGKATGKLKSKVKGDMLLRPKGIEIDPRFYGEKQDEIRMNAVRAKFTKNEDLRLMLLATKDALLVEYIHGSEPVKDDVLMKVRYEINGS